MPELKIVAALLILFLFACLPLLLARAGTALTLYVLPILPAICIGLLVFLDQPSLLPLLELFVGLLAYLLFTYGVAGGIEFDLRFTPTPLNNATYLVLAGLAANVLGGIGATLVFLGPLARANAGRRHVRHIPIFFTIVVTHLGGLVSPMGAPHLFVLHIFGVPAVAFLNLVPLWLAMQATLILLFLAYDFFVLSNEPIQSDPRSALYEDLHRALQKQEVPQSLVLRTIDYLELPTASFRGGLSVFAIPVALVVVVLADHFGNAFHSRELVLAALGATCGLLAWRRTPAPTTGSAMAVPLLAIAVVFFAYVAFVFLPLWSRSLAAAGPARGHLAGLPLPVLTGLLSAAVDNTTAILAALVVRLPGDGPLFAGFAFVPPAWKALFTDRASLAILAVLPALLGGLTYAGDQANIVVRKVCEVNGIRMPGFFAHALASAGLAVAALVAGAAVYLWLY